MKKIEAVIKQFKLEVDTISNALINAARTGKIGDGKIYKML